MANVGEMLIAETDGSCAYCGIKDYRILTIHHIIQQEPKDESYDNKIILCHNCHHLYHEKKGPSLQELTDIKKRLIYKTLTQQGVNALKESYRKGMVVGSPYLLGHLVELQLLKFLKKVSSYSMDSNKNTIMNAVYEITSKGRGFAEKWSIK